MQLTRLILVGFPKPKSKQIQAQTIRPRSKLLPPVPADNRHIHKPSLCNAQLCHWVQRINFLTPLPPASECRPCQSAASSYELVRRPLTCRWTGALHLTWHNENILIAHTYMETNSYATEQNAAHIHCVSWITSNSQLSVSWWLAKHSAVLIIIPQVHNFDADSTKVVPDHTWTAWGGVTRDY